MRLQDQEYVYRRIYSTAGSIYLSRVGLFKTKQGHAFIKFIIKIEIKIEYFTLPSQGFSVTIC